MAFVEISKSRARGRRMSDDSASSMALHKSGSRNGAPTFQLSLRLSNNLVKHMRWQIGDRVKVLIDDERENTILLQRVPVGGWAISYAGGKKQAVKKHRVQISNFTGINIAHGELHSCKQFEEAHGGVVLQFEKQLP